MSLILRRCFSLSQSKFKVDLEVEILNLAISSNLILKSGWSEITLLNSNSNSNLNSNSLQALFPSNHHHHLQHPTTSLSRQQLIKDAKSSSSTILLNHHRSGPAQALFQHWLIYARHEMLNYIKLNNLSGLEAIKAGLKARIAFNHTHGKLDDLPDALALLSASTSISPLPLVTLPSPTPYLEHIAQIAHDVTKASGSQDQGTDWYAVRAKAGSIYALAELHLISPDLANLTPEARVDSTNVLIDRMFTEVGAIERQLKDATLFGEFVFKSWRGLFRSAGF